MRAARPARPLPPALAGVLTGVAGIFVLVGSWTLTVLPAVRDALVPYASPQGAGYYLGALLGVVGVALVALPRRRRVLGGVALALGAASVPLALGGLIVGFLLAAIGGGLAVSRPSVPPAAPLPPAAPGRAPPWS